MHINRDVRHELCIIVFFDIILQMLWLEPKPRPSHFDVKENCVLLVYFNQAGYCH